MDIALNDPLQQLLDGRPVWVWPDGTTLPVIRGGDGPAPAPAPPADPPADPAPGDPPADPPPADPPADPPESKVEFTAEQKAEMGRRIAEERAKAKTTAEANAKKAIEQAAERAKMDETERAKAEKADAETAAKTATDAANRKLVAADAKVAAVGAGVPADRVDAFVKLADLTEVAVDDDGTVDSKALGKAVKKTLESNPFLKADPKGPGRSGADMNGNGGKQPATSLEDAIAARLGG